MKILQRRTKRTTVTPEMSDAIVDNKTHVLSAHINRYQNMLSVRWQALSSRDQLALVILSLFLLAFIGGYGSYSIHQAANERKNAYQEQVADYFWLRAQAGNIDSTAINAANTADGAAAMPPANRVSTLLNDSGIVNPQVVAVGDAVQLSFDHASQAVVSAALGKLEQQGWHLTQLSMQQDITDKSIQVQATITS